MELNSNLQIALRIVTGTILPTCAVPRPRKSPRSIPHACNYQALDPGIRLVTMYINAMGYRTTDSGDGITKQPGPDVREYPHVSCPGFSASDLSGLEHCLTACGLKIVPVGQDEPLSVQIQFSVDVAECRANKTSFQIGLVDVMGLNDKSLATAVLQSVQAIYDENSLKVSSLLESVNSLQQTVQELRKSQALL